MPCTPQPLIAFSLALAVAANAQTIITDPAGLSQTVENRQPGLALHMVVQTQGQFGIGVPIRIFAYSNAVMAGLASPSGSGGWVPADGRLLPINSNQALFSQLGTNFGGTGVTNFAIPDLRGRVMVGEGVQGGVSYDRGQAMGSATTTLTEANLPPHSHTEADAVGSATSITGAAAPLDTMQPSLVVRASIIPSGLFPCRDCDPFSAMAVPPTNGYTSQILFHAATPFGSWEDYYTPANGALRPINSNQALFSLIGTYFGGNGVTTFALPDLRGRVGVNAGQRPGLSPWEIGQVAGSRNVSLVIGNLPLHSHTVPPAGAAQTGSTGQPAPAAFSTVQPSQGVSYWIAVYGVYPSSNSMNDQAGYNGEIIAMGNNFSPAGYLPCDGRLLSTDQFDTLFSLIGTTYGGDGVDTFALPDLRGRVPIGASLAAGGLQAGATVGVESVVMTTSSMAAHTHSFARACAADVGVQGGEPGHDGFRDNNDFVVFVNMFFAHDPAADIGRQGGAAGEDGFWNNNDFVVFIDRFFAVCP